MPRKNLPAGLVVPTLQEKRDVRCGRIVQIISRCLLGLCLVVIASFHANAEIRILTVTTAAGFHPELPSPGSLASVFCTGLTVVSGIQLSPGPPYPLEFAGIHVTVYGIPAPILSVASLVGYQQINIQMPWQRGDGQVLKVFEGADEASIAPFSTQGWGVFFTDSDGYVVAQHAVDYAAVTRANPARPGEWIVAYATNLGPVQFQPATNMAANATPLSPVIMSSTDPQLALSVALLDSPLELIAETNYIGLAPFLVGVYQVNFRVPLESSPGDRSLFISKYESCYFLSFKCGSRGSFSISTTSVMVKLPVAGN